MDLRQLSALAAVADAGSFSAAARHLHTVQSNVSTHVARLERELGATLVDRSTGALTDEGEVVLDIIHRLQATQAGDLAVRWNCKAGKCGSCSAEINGRPRLMCMTRLDSLDLAAPVTVEPMRAFPLIKDLATDAIQRISTDAAGEEGNRDSSRPVFSPDGSKVAFGSSASNLVPGDTNDQGEVFVKDLRSGAIERISTAADGTQGNSGRYGPAFSPDGGKVAFTSVASNLVPGDTNSQPDVFVRDRVTGTTERVSVSSAGVEGVYNSGSPAISDDGLERHYLPYMFKGKVPLWLRQMTREVIAQAEAGGVNPRDYGVLPKPLSMDMYNRGLRYFLWIPGIFGTLLTGAATVAELSPWYQSCYFPPCY